MPCRVGVEPLPFYRHLNQNRLEGTLLAIDLEDMKLGKVKLLLAYYLEFPGSLFRNIDNLNRINNMNWLCPTLPCAYLLEAIK